MTPRAARKWDREIVDAILAAGRPLLMREVVDRVRLDVGWRERVEWTTVQNAVNLAVVRGLIVRRPRPAGGKQDRRAKFIYDVYRPSDKFSQDMSGVKDIK